MTEKTSSGRWQKAGFIVENDSQDPKTILVCGRVRWALECLLAAGQRGCTPIDTPGPRWSHYVWVLREEGVAIETVNEPHGGPFSGTHARYVLRSKVRRIGTGEAAA